MKSKFGGTLIALSLLASTLQVPALVGLTASVDGTNVVLSWPSTGTENYLIQYRAAFDANNPWTNLTNNYPAAPGTNRTGL